MNYFPKRLMKVVAPSDSRWRPDQRNLENGDLINAAKEKDRLEVKQRKVRKYKEERKIEHKTCYFSPVAVPEDNDLVYHLYNGLYFEVDRKKQSWERVPDIYSDKLELS
mmetsp:Transcript_3355/g.5604  ORF Transcript_3355/g.5604 Transcript_3355/m.5604 type:complete len:109 (+) Transcript_3355:956-1282(+)